jgi:hypothetical protein
MLVFLKSRQPDRLPSVPAMAGGYFLGVLAQRIAQGFPLALGPALAVHQFGLSPGVPFPGLALGSKGLALPDRIWAGTDFDLLPDGHCCGADCGANVGPVGADCGSKKRKKPLESGFFYSNYKLKLIT